MKYIKISLLHISSHDTNKFMFSLLNNCTIWFKFVTWTNDQNTGEGRPLIKVWRQSRKTFLLLYCLFFLIKVCRQSRKTFLLLYCLFFIKVSDFSRKPFCFRPVFSLLLFFIFLLLSFALQRLFITSSFFRRCTSNFQHMLRITRWSLLLNFKRNQPRGRDRAWSWNFVYFIIEKLRRDKNFTLLKTF